jgi:4,5-DOPA dioxygenase extradiol
MAQAAALFISHGSPLTVVTEDDYAQALRALGASLPRPRAVVVVSAHGLSPDGQAAVTAGPAPPLVYDFGGFPPELYRIQYPCPGQPALAGKIADRLASLSLQVQLREDGGIDHGVWVPLARLFPGADVPVVQVTMPYPSSPRVIYEMGRALAPLRDEEVLLVGSGGAVHNLRALNWHSRSKQPVDWAAAFDSWLRRTVEQNDSEELLAYDTRAPQPHLAHPTPDHLYPVFFTVGARLPTDRPRTIVEEFQYETLSMYCFALEGQAAA